MAGSSTVTTSSGRASVNPPWGASLVVLLAAFVPVLVAMQRGTGPHDTAFVLQLLLVAYAGARLALVVVSGRLTVLRGSFWLFVYTAMGVAPMAQLVLGQFPTPVVGNRADLVLAVFVVLLGCVAFDLGYWLMDRYGREPEIRLDTGLGRADERSPLAQQPGIAVLSAFSLAASAFLVLRLGGLSTFFTSRQTISAELAESGLASAESQVGSAMVRGFGTVPVLVMLLVVTRWVLMSPQARRSPGVRLIGVALLLANVVVNNPVSNPRYWALTVLMSLVLVIAGSGVAAYRWVLLGGLVAALVLFPYADRFRYDEEGARPLESESVMETLALKDFDQLAMTANAVAHTRLGEGFTGGDQLLGSALFFVPRQVWPDKATDTGLLLGEWLGTNNTNLSAPLWAELWIDFGYVGVLAGFAALGLGAGYWDARYERALLERRGPGSALMVIVPIVAGYAFILLRGSLLQATGRVAVLVVMGALITMVSRRTRSP